MFWSTPKCPVDAGMKRWIEARMGWLLGQFGEERVLSQPLILPNEAFYPDPYDGSEEAGHLIVARTCKYMNVDPARIAVRFYRPERHGQFVSPRTPLSPGWAGLYNSDEEFAETIWIDCAMLDDAMGLVATLSHELSHAILLGEKRISRDVPDMEKITDLATVALGMGVFNANASFRTHNYTAGSMHYSRTSTIGYLTPPSFGYALAVLAWLRKEKNPPWMCYLNTSAGAACKQGLAFLNKSGDAAIVTGEALNSISWCDLFPNTGNDQESLVDTEDAELDQEAYEAGASETEADRLYVGACLYAESGNWQEAADAYSELLKHGADDGEVYKDRAWAYLELNRVADAVADAEKAVALLPDEPDAWCVRGAAYVQARRFDDAIADLSRFLSERDYKSSDERRSQAYYWRGLSHAGKGDHQAALKDFSKAITCWPRWPDPYRARAEIYEERGKLGEAAQDRKEATRRETTNPRD